jgi:hypothetical protein
MSGDVLLLIVLLAAQEGRGVDLRSGREAEDEPQSDVIDLANLPRLPTTFADTAEAFRLEQVDRITRGGIVRSSAVPSDRRIGGVSIPLTLFVCLSSGLGRILPRLARTRRRSLSIFRRISRGREARSATASKPKKVRKMSLETYILVLNEELLDLL